MQDKQLVEKILAGDDRAISLFYRRYRKKLLVFIERKVRQGPAEEITQDVFVSALESLPIYKGKSSLYSWLLGIARHEIADFYRKKKIKEIVFSRLPFLEKLVSKALSPEIAYEEKELKEKIKRSFVGVSEGYRQILRLKYCEGYSVADLAKKLGVTYKSAESKLFRARLAFQQEFEHQGKNGYQAGDFNSSS